jgi:two-component system, OmpR family, alkaline phosphatase synthesis response regulator PhoP
MRVETVMGKKILVVEDEAGLRLTLGDRLRNEGYQVTVAPNGIEGFRLATSDCPDMLVLDLMLPGKSGLEVCRDLRQGGSMVPILMLTAKDQTIDKVVGLKLGADDYLTKPFEMQELLARIEALLRRASAITRSGLQKTQFGPFVLDYRRMEVFRDSEQLALSAKEFQLLGYFIEHRNELLSRERLLEEVWGYDSSLNTRTVDVHVAWLRKKLEDDAKNPRWILTVHGQGYRFEG